MFVRTLAGFCVFAFLVGCGGGGNANAPAGSLPATSAGGTTSGTASLTILDPKTAAVGKRQVQFVSPSTVSLALSVNGGTTTYSDVSATSSLCTPVSGGRTCTVSLAAPIGTDTLSAQLYDAASGAGTLLGRGTSSVTTVAGQPFTVTITVNPVIGSAINPAFTFASGTAFSAGTAGTATVAFTLLDPDGNAITLAATPAFATPLQLTSGDAHVTVSPATWTGPTQAITLTYDGSLAVGSNVVLSVKATTATIGTATTATIFHYVVSTFAGTTGTAGSLDGPALSATFNGPVGVAAAADGSIYVADRYSDKVRKISAGTVSTFSGTGVLGSLDGPALTATYDYPIALAFDPAGDLYVADHDNNKIRAISAAGIVSTLAGSGASGATDGPGATATFAIPQGVVLDAAGNLYIPDLMNNKIRMVTPAGFVSTYAGTGVAGAMDGAATTTATFNQPSGVAIDSAGNVYVGDTYNNKIRKISTAGVVSTIAGTGASAPFADGAAATATFNHPQSIVLDSSGDLYVSDQFNQRIRKITPAGIVSTVAGSGAAGSTDGVGTSASFNNPTGLTVDAHGNIYVADFTNNTIRMIAP